MNKIKLLLLNFCLMCSLVYAGPINEIKIVIPTAPGGPGDQMGRIVQTALIDELKIPVVVEYKLGAGGTLASQYVNNAPVSEKIIYLTGLGFISNALKDEEFAKIKNVNYLTTTGYSTSVLVASKKSGIKNWDDFLRASKAKELTYGSAGIGTTPHMFVEIVGSKINRKFIHVPFKGQAQAIPMIINGDVDFGMMSKTAVIQHIQVGSLVPIAVVAQKRDTDLPNIVTLTEKKIVGIEEYMWNSMFTNQPVDSEDFKTIQTTLHKVLTDPVVNQQLVDMDVYHKKTKLGANKDFIARERTRLLKDTQNLSLD